MALESNTWQSRQEHGKLNLGIVDALAQSKYGLLNYNKEPALKNEFLPNPTFSLHSLASWCFFSFPSVPCSIEELIYACTVLKHWKTHPPWASPFPDHILEGNRVQIHFLRKSNKNFKLIQRPPYNGELGSSLSDFPVNPCLVIQALHSFSARVENLMQSELGFFLWKKGSIRDLVNIFVNSHLYLGHWQLLALSDPWAVVSSIFFFSLVLFQAGVQWL